MLKLPSLAATVFVALAAASLAQESVAESKPKPTEATFLISGLHCPPCTTTVESSLRKVEGIVAVKVDWKTKTAQMEFDEAVLPAHRIGLLVAKTPHMMGGNLHYAAWLYLRVPRVKDEVTANQAKEVLEQIEGIKQAAAYPKQHGVSVLFAPECELTTSRLMTDLKDKGFEVEAAEQK